MSRGFSAVSLLAAISVAGVVGLWSARTSNVSSVATVQAESPAAADAPSPAFQPCLWQSNYYVMYSCDTGTNIEYWVPIACVGTGIPFCPSSYLVRKIGCITGSCPSDNIGWISSCFCAYFQTDAFSNPIPHTNPGLTAWQSKFTAGEVLWFPCAYTCVDTCGWELEECEETAKSCHDCRE